MNADVLDTPRRELRDNETITRSGAQTITVTYPPDPTPQQIMRLQESSGALEFWNAPEEDIYTPDDGTRL